MINLYKNGVYLLRGREIVEDTAHAKQIIKAKLGIDISKEDAVKGTMAYCVMKNHNQSANMEELKLRFDALVSNDIGYVNIIQTARAIGLDRFPLPYILTNCHSTLCAVGGTLNEDDHMFGLACAQKFGGIYVPAHQAVMHQYMREMVAKSGDMILGSDSHTRYGVLGAMAIGEGGGEVVKQLISKTYDIKRPEVIAAYITGELESGAIGPHDIALAIIEKVYACSYVKNKVIEFIGDGIKSLSMDYRMGIDTMTTETACLSSIWETDDKALDYFELHDRKQDYRKLYPNQIAFYDGMIYIDLSKIKPMIALPFHPSNVYAIEELNRNADEILLQIEKQGQDLLDNIKIKFSLRDKLENGILHIQQAVIGGCVGGTFENICAASDILERYLKVSSRFPFSIYPASQPIFLQLLRNGSVENLTMFGVTVRTAFCGPCFGLGDIPSNGDLSIRHIARNFPSREGSLPNNGQIASVALMDARSIAATVINGGKLTPATELNVSYTDKPYYFDKTIYNKCTYNGYKKEQPQIQIKFGPGITDWPRMSGLTENIMLKVASVINDSVTTTDELIPAGETASFRSNPSKMAGFMLSRKDPGYVVRTKEIQGAEIARLKGEDPKQIDKELEKAFNIVGEKFNITSTETGLGSVLYAKKPGEGSAREQAASCQKVLGGWANIAEEYATKRYRSNLINWGILPFILKGETLFEIGDFIFIPNIRKAISMNEENIKAYIVRNRLEEFNLVLNELTKDEREILLSGCLINFYK